MRRIVLGLIFATASAHAGCPINECNYQDAQYQTAFNNWTNCTSAPINAWLHAIDVLSISYPRFGIAWASQKAEINRAIGTSTVDQVSASEANRRFEDRILSTAETEALQYYNLFRLKFDQQIKQCGELPQPPRGQPQ